MSPTVDTTSANVAVNLSDELIQGTPGGRDIWALVEAKVPGLVMSRPDVGGTSGGADQAVVEPVADAGRLHALQEQNRERRSEEHTSELQSPCNLVCRLLLEKKNT